MLYQHIRFGIDGFALLRDTQHEFSDVIRSDLFEPFPLHVGLNIAVNAALVIRPAAKGQIGAVKIHPSLRIVVEQRIILDPLAKEIQFFHIFIFRLFRPCHSIYLHIPFGKHLRMRGYKNNNRSCGGDEF